MTNVVVLIYRLREWPLSAVTNRFELRCQLKQFFSFHFILNYLYRVKTFSSYGKKTALQCALLKQKRKNKKKRKKINYSINSKFYLIHCQINSLKKPNFNYSYPTEKRKLNCNRKEN